MFFVFWIGFGLNLVCCIESTNYSMLYNFILSAHSVLLFSTAGESGKVRLFDYFTLSTMPLIVGGAYVVFEIGYGQELLSSCVQILIDAALVHPLYIVTDIKYDISCNILQEITLIDLCFCCFVYFSFLMYQDLDNDTSREEWSKKGFKYLAIIIAPLEVIFGFAAIVGAVNVY